MKKLFTLLMLMVCAIGTAWADTYEWSRDGQKKSLTVAAKKGTSDASTYSKYSISYDGATYTTAVKMESATTITFETNANANITIGIALKDKNSYEVEKATVKLNGKESESAISEATVGASKENGVSVTFADVPAGTQTITRGGSELGVFYVKVEETGAVLTKLSTPTITVNSETGVVTISSVENASKITYTLDGTIPTAESAEYKEPFTAEDGTTVSAVAVGDGTTYSNSDVVTATVLLDVVSVAAPTIKQFNGTVAITCETAGTTIEYSLDGTTYSPYTRAFTLTEDGTVYARAKRGDNTSAVASASVTTIGKGSANKTIWMGIGSFTDNDKNVMTGTVGDDAEGIIMAITGNTGKNWSSGTLKIKVGDIERTTIKLSNGAQNTMTLPEGMQATRITFYSVINSDEGRTSYWKEFNGTEINDDVPMGAWNSVSDRLTNPDVRVFSLNGESSITFTNAGEQLFFIIALDVIEAEDPVLNVNAEELTFKTSPYSKTATATVKLTGSYLTDGDYDVTLPSISGLSIEPTSFTVADRSVSQEFTLTYAPEAGETTTATLNFGTPEASAEVSLVFENRAETYELAEVSEATTWDWAVFDKNKTIKLDGSSSPAQTDEFVMKELETELAFGSFPAESIALRGQYPTNKQKFQNGTIRIKTTTSGIIKVDFSDTGVTGDNPSKRYLVVNGQITAYYTQRDGSTSDKKTGCEVAVPAGDVTITGTEGICIYKLTFTPADAPAITATITAAGYATFSSLFEVAIPEGVEAYYASASEGSTVTMTSIDGGVIPAGTGVVLKGNEGSYTMTVSETGATLDATNLLKANIADREPGEAEYYTLAAGPKFSKSTGGVLAAGKAYLVLSASSSRSIDMVFDGSATGISELEATADEGAVYNLSGVRVSQPTKGLYIKNGKKFVK